MLVEPIFAVTDGGKELAIRGDYSFHRRIDFRSVTRMCSLTKRLTDCSHRVVLQ